MVHSADYWKLRNGERYQTSIDCILSNNGITEEIADRSSSENVGGEIPVCKTLTY